MHLKFVFGCLFGFISCMVSKSWMALNSLVVPSAASWSCTN